jgi:hypothetical protein
MSLLYIHTGIQTGGRERERCGTTSMKNGPFAKEREREIIIFCIGVSLCASHSSNILFKPKTVCSLEVILFKFIGHWT